MTQAYPYANLHTLLFLLLKILFNYALWTVSLSVTFLFTIQNEFFSCYCCLYIRVRLLTTTVIRINMTLK